MKKAVEKVKNEPDNLIFRNNGRTQYGVDNYNVVINNCQAFVDDVIGEYEEAEGVTP
jgi:hypothetical protein